MDRKPTVSEVSQRANQLRRSIRRRLSLVAQDHELTADRMLSIQQKIVPYSWYFDKYDLLHHEVGLAFVLKHVQHALQEAGASRSEAKTLTRIIGKVHGQAPEYEIDAQIAAARKISEMGDRGEELYLALRHAYADLVRKDTAFKRTLDESGLPDFGYTLFSNPLSRVWERNLNTLLERLEQKKNSSTHSRYA